MAMVAYLNSFVSVCLLATKLKWWNKYLNSFVSVALEGVFTDGGENNNVGMSRIIPPTRRHAYEDGARDAGILLAEG